MDEARAAPAAEASLEGTLPLGVKVCMAPLCKDLARSAVPKAADPA